MFFCKKLCNMSFYESFGLQISVLQSRESLNLTCKPLKNVKWVARLQLLLQPKLTKTSVVYSVSKMNKTPPKFSNLCLFSKRFRVHQYSYIIKILFFFWILLQILNILFSPQVMGSILYYRTTILFSSIDTKSFKTWRKTNFGRKIRYPYKKDLDCFWAKSICGKGVKWEVN